MAPEGRGRSGDMGHLKEPLSSKPAPFEHQDAWSGRPPNV